MIPMSSYLEKHYADLLKAMSEHASELEARDERHVYGVAMNYIRLQNERIAELTAMLAQAHDKRGISDD